MSGPAIPDISITLVGILFLIYAFKNSDFYWLRIDWIKAGIIFWISLINFFLKVCAVLNRIKFIIFKENNHNIFYCIIAKKQKYL